MVPYYFASLQNNVIILGGEHSEMFTDKFNKNIFKRMFLFIYFLAGWLLQMN